MRFDPEYVSQVLNENFEDAKTLFLGPLMSIHYAHLVMLADRRIIGADAAHTLREALDRVSLSDIPAHPTTGRAKTSSSTSSGCSSTRAAMRQPAACTPRAAATTST
jgi:hypothetical protein